MKVVVTPVLSQLVELNEAIGLCLGGGQKKQGKLRSRPA